MNALFETGELLFSDETFTDWNGTVLAKVQKPRRTLRSMFTTGQLHITRADESPLFTMPEPGDDTPDELPITSPDGGPMLLIKKKRGLSIVQLKFSVLDTTGTTMGTMATNQAWNEVSAKDLSESTMATAEISGRSWTIDLKPETPSPWTIAIMAMTITADELYYNLGDIG